MFKNMWENAKYDVSKIKYSWSKVTIGEWQKFMKLRRDFIKKAKDKSMGSLDFNLAQIEHDNTVLAIFSGMDADYWDNVDIAYRNNALTKLKFLSSEMPEINIKSSYKIGDIKYNVDMSQENFMRNSIASLMTSQYISLMEQYNDSPDEYTRAMNLHIEMSIICIPKGKVYGEGDYNAFTVSEHLKENMTIDIASSISKFFFLKWTSLITAMEGYLKKQLHKEMKKKITDQKKLAELKEMLNRIERLSRQMDLCHDGGGHIM